MGIKARLQTNYAYQKTSQNYFSSILVSMIDNINEQSIKELSEDVNSCHNKAHVSKLKLTKEQPKI